MISSNSRNQNHRDTKFLSSSGIRDAKCINVDNGSGRLHPLFGSQCILNFGVLAVRNIELRSRFLKNVDELRSDRSKVRSLHNKDSSDCSMKK